MFWWCDPEPVAPRTWLDDREAIASDWRAVGDDLRRAMDKAAAGQPPA